MIGKIIKGKSFKGCISYVLEKEKAQLLDSEGVLLNDTQSIINILYAKFDKSETGKMCRTYPVELFQRRCTH